MEQEALLERLKMSYIPFGGPPPPWQSISPLAKAEALLNMSEAAACGFLSKDQTNEVKAAMAGCFE